MLRTRRVEAEEEKPREHSVSFGALAKPQAQALEGTHSSSSSSGSDTISATLRSSH